MAPTYLDEAPEDDFAFFTRALTASVLENLQASWMPHWLETVDALRHPVPVSTIA
jgi:hypothetical protein